jgi:hypothetical protein
MMKTRVWHGNILAEASELDRLSIWPSFVEGRLKIKMLSQND